MFVYVASDKHRFGIMGDIMDKAGNSLTFTNVV